MFNIIACSATASNQASKTLINFRIRPATCVIKNAPQVKIEKLPEPQTNSVNIVTLLQLYSLFIEYNLVVNRTEFCLTSRVRYPEEQ
jgi:hypothetical protein